MLPLGRNIDVHLLFIKPCRYDWGDIQDSAFLNRLMHQSTSAV
ncbi:exodeoxyribonuclease V subunit gamma [Candidatus Hoaglandella endobia]|nr:exodeoxyribonuclease V subunit gamma [Candidatus Hoaglandella endobia]